MQYFILQYTHAWYTMYKIHAIHYTCLVYNVYNTCNTLHYNIHITQYTLGCPIFWSLSQKIKQFRRRSVGCVNQERSTIFFEKF